MKSTFLLSAAVICLVACNRHPSEPIQFKPGDADYPAETPNPSHAIALNVSRLELSNYRFDAAYQSDPKLCNQMVGLGVYVPRQLAIPINMTRGESDGYRGSFAIDKFQPGKCGWKFTGVYYSWPGSETRNSLGVFTERQGIAPSNEPHIDMWCYTVTNGQSQSVEPKCETLAGLRWPNADRRINPEFLSRFSQERQNENGTVGITMDTKELSLDFHDLTSTPGVLMPVGDRAEQAKAAKESSAAYEASPEAKVESCFQTALGAYIRSHPDIGEKPAGTEVAEIRGKCRAEFGLAPVAPRY